MHYVYHPVLLGVDACMVVNYILMNQKCIFYTEHFENNSSTGYFKKILGP